MKFLSQTAIIACVLLNTVNYHHSTFFQPKLIYTSQLKLLWWGWKLRLAQPGMRACAGVQNILGIRHSSAHVHRSSMRMRTAASCQVGGFYYRVLLALVLYTFRARKYNQYSLGLVLYIFRLSN